jgi:tetratricopeptide (TPR) repeat protein
MVAAFAAGCMPTPEERDAKAAREHVYRGDLALARAQAETAEAEYRAALALGGDHGEARLGLARAQTALGRDLEALASFDALAELDPERVAALHGAEVCPLLLRAAPRQLGAGESGRALELARRARREGCEASAVAPVLAHALSAFAEGVRGSDPERAADLYAAAAAADPADALAFARAGTLLLMLERREEALTLLSEALRLHPRDTALQALMVDALAGRVPIVDPFTSSLR